MTPLFDVLPSDSKLLCSSSRVVQLMRSTTYESVSVAGPVLPYRASLILVFTLRGSYALYIHLEPKQGGNGTLMGGKRAESAIGQYALLQQQAMEWLSSCGFVMKAVELGGLPWAERKAVLSFLPFAHHDPGDPSQGTQAAEPEEASNVAGVLPLFGENPPKNVRLLRDFLISG
ncbi:MAG: hypothetical protein RBU37_21115 [Myxococcota bacterium]|nr:hypothetical protein [Myxococcota bacterium]